MVVLSVELSSLRGRTCVMLLDGMTVLVEPMSVSVNLKLIQLTFYVIFEVSESANTIAVTVRRAFPHRANAAETPTSRSSKHQ